MLPKFSRSYFAKRERGIRHQNLVARYGSEVNDDLNVQFVKEDQIGSKTSSSASEDDGKEIESQKDMDEVTPQVDEEDQIGSKISSSESEDDCEQGCLGDFHDRDNGQSVEDAR